MDDSMDIDAFAQKMLERTQARRDMLNKKLPLVERIGNSREQREPLTEDKTNEQNFYSVKADQEETLKRKSSELETIIVSPKRRSVEAPKGYLDKENEDCNEDCETTKTDVRGLAALRHKTSDEIAGVFSSKPQSQKELLVDNTPTNVTLQASPHITHARSRLAALASNINQWEDDLPSAITKEQYMHDTSREPTKTKETPISKLPPSKFTIKPTNTLADNPAISKTLQSPVKEMVAVSVAEVKPKWEEPAKTVLKQVRKNHVWDDDVIATLEAQGFTKSASASKLSYKYQEKGDSSIKDRLKMFENQNNSTSSKKAATLPRKLPPTAEIFTPKETIPVESQVILPQKPVTIKPIPHTVSKTPSSSQNTPANSDPSSLPLSARKALFESPVSVQSSVTATPELLSVSQRAALFEKAMNFSPKEGNTCTPKSFLPKKNSSSVLTPALPVTVQVNAPLITPTNQSAPNMGILKSGSLVKDVSEEPKKIVHFSPSKNIATHTAQLQQDLLEKVNKPSTSSNEIANKMIEERKRELEELKQRWNRSPKKAFNPFGSNHEQNNESDMESSDSREAISQESMADESEIDGSVNSPIPPPPPPPMSARYTEDSQPKQPMTPQSSFTTQSRIVCEKFDAMLDEVMNDYSSSESEEGPSPSLYPSLSKLKKLSNSPTKVNVSPVKGIRYIEENHNEEYDSTTEDSSRDETTLSPSKIYPSLPSASGSNVSPTKAYVNPVTNESESPVLIHSVSLYRRQNQQLSNNNTPVKVVKRKIEIDLSPARQEDNEYFLEVQDRIKQLQEDLHRQDVQVKQACQALFLCAAKQEFFGSTEHVEGERLLLITTHKRNSCKNSIEQLKTEAALGFNPAGERGTLSISDIRLPLKQEFLTAQLGGQMYESIHYFFCLIRYREKVIATEMLNTRDNITAGTFSFSNHICLQDLRSNFSVLFEVYALQTNAQNVPHDRKYNIRKEHSKLKITPKSKKQESKTKVCPALSNPEPKERASNFDVVGVLKLNIDNCRRRLMGLEKVPKQSPLDGRITMKLKLCTEQPVKEKGFLTMFEDVSGFGNWHRRWFVLLGNHLSYWKYPDHEKTEVPMGVIDLRQCITAEVGLINPNVCVRKHTFSLLTVRPKNKQDHNTLVSQSHNTYTTTEIRLSADTKEERILWCTRFNQALDIIRKWDPEALRPIELNESRA